MVARLNELYTIEKTLHEMDFEEAGFNWTQIDKEDDSILCFERIAKDPKDFLMVIMNNDQQTHYDYPLKIRRGLTYAELFNSDSEEWGGSGILNEGEYSAADIEEEGKGEIKIIIPPLSLLIFKPNK